MPQTDAPVSSMSSAVPWYRDVTGAQWAAFFSAYLGWVLVAFDFYIVTFLLSDIEHSFAVNNALAGWLATVTLMFRMVGGIAAGALSDRLGRKAPLVVSIAWYSIFVFAGGFSPNYLVLFTCRALFGIGMGGVWASGMPLAIEHWPARLRGKVSGMLQSGYSTGSIIAAIAYATLYPALNTNGLGWRAMMWVGIFPIFVAAWIWMTVKESPIWLERQSHARRANVGSSFSIGRLFEGELLPITVQTSVMMGAFLIFYYSITFWYARYVQGTGRASSLFVAALGLGTMIGNMIWGELSQRPGVGRRGAATIATAGGIACIPFFLFTTTPAAMYSGAFLMGLFGAGNFGIIPTYLNERFPTVVRASGAGFAYHVGAFLASFITSFIGHLHDTGMPLNVAMAWCIGVSGVIAIAMVRIGPETRGREFETTV
jgi:SHS family lactate transporter-like MFS transporter